MPAARTQKEKATTPEGREAKTRWSCPFPGCHKTTSKKPDVRRHYRTHFDWVPFQCPFYATCKFQSQQESNVVVHIEQTRMHPDVSADDLAKAKPVRVLPESSAPQLPLGWDKAPVASAPVRPTANPRRLPATVRRTVAASEAPVGSLENFRILNLNFESKPKYQRVSRRSRSTEAPSQLCESESSDEELSNGPSTPSASPSPSDGAEIVTPVYHMTAEEIQFPDDFFSKTQFGEMDVKPAVSLTWTWDQLIAANVTDYTKPIFAGAEVPTAQQEPAVDFDMFGQVERPLPELIPGYETTDDLFGWDLTYDKLFPASTITTATMATGSDLSLPEDTIFYNLSAAPSPKFNNDLSMTGFEDSPSPVISAAPVESFDFSPADYSMAASGVDSFDAELFLDSVDWSSWSPTSVDWEELAQFQASS
ncbi:hypothetical protein M413DRAFT_9506 [Hebeloma cylindrosporum]|uniref:C2H2-type domain-containing protein n=1 Tax=Hebeloma cylindrosporum TaxID=76867 RepID=A0A0C2Y0P5_HEBCY|nr:hypothetical protein M413DRAFT_9506 [Hebeloma cylindrosporum h7]